METSIIAMLITISSPSVADGAVDRGVFVQAYRTHTMQGFQNIGACKSQEGAMIRTLRRDNIGATVSARCIAVPNSREVDQQFAEQGAGIQSMFIEISAPHEIRANGQIVTVEKARTYTIHGFRSSRACQLAEPAIVRQARLGNENHRVKVNCYALGVAVAKT